MRVALVVEQAWQPVPGGTARAALELLRELRARVDLDVVPVAARHQSPAPPPWTVPPPVVHLPLPRIALYEGWRRLRRPRVQRACGPVDVVHATSLAVPPAGGAALVVTVHDLAFRHHPGHFTARGRRFFEHGLALVRAEADLVLCPSDTTARECAAAGLPADRLRVVPHGVRVEPVDGTRVARFRAAHHLDRDYVLWCGTLEPRKNLATLLAAFRRLVDRGHDLDLVLAGPPGWGSVAGLAGGKGVPESERVRLDGLPADRVRRLGFLAPPELAAAYAGARVFCYPSVSEGFGLPVLEAMAHAIPVVTSRGTATEEAADGAALLVPPTDVEALADALAAAAGPRHDELARAGVARAAEATWRRAADATVAVYREALDLCREGTLGSGR